MSMRKSEGSRSRIGVLAILPALVPVVFALLLPDKAQAEERKFIVLLAHSIKQADSDDPGVVVNDVRQAYFAEDVGKACGVPTAYVVAQGDLVIGCVGDKFLQQRFDFSRQRRRAEIDPRALQIRMLVRDDSAQSPQRRLSYIDRGV